MNRAARSRFPGQVERPRARGHTRAKLQLIADNDDTACDAALDGLVDGQSDLRAKAILRRLVRKAHDRLGLTIETSTLFGALATDASLGATKGEGSAGA